MGYDNRYLLLETSANDLLSGIHHIIEATPQPVCERSFLGRFRATRHVLARSLDALLARVRLEKLLRPIFRRGYPE